MTPTAPSSPTTFTSKSESKSQAGAISKARAKTKSKSKSKSKAGAKAISISISKSTPTFPHLQRAALALMLALLALGTVSCAKVNHLMKAKATTPSAGFLDFRATPDNQTARSPWHYAAFSTDQTLLGIAHHRQLIYIAPVKTNQLRPISKKLAQSEYTRLRPQQTREIADTLRREFARALTAAPGSPWKLALKPGKNTLILELNLIELDPTSVKGNITKTVVKYTLSPIASMGVGLFTGGRIAVEGRLREGTTRSIVMQFADREKDKATIYSARDYMALGHSTRTAREWAEQFTTFLRSNRNKVKDSFFLTPMVY